MGENRGKKEGINRKTGKRKKVAGNEENDYTKEKLTTEIYKKQQQK